MNNDWIKNLKAGDKVIVCRGDISRHETIETVDKVTPTGRIKVGCRYYNRCGFARGDYSFRLREATSEVLEAIRQKEVIRKAVSRALAMRTDSITYEQAAKLLEVLNDGT